MSEYTVLLESGAVAVVVCDICELNADTSVLSGYDEILYPNDLQVTMGRQLLAHIPNVIGFYKGINNENNDSSRAD